MPVDPNPRNYHGYYSRRADRAFGSVSVYESLADGAVVGEARCTMVGTPEYASTCRWEDMVDLGPVGKHLRNEITDVAQKAAYDDVFGLTPWTDAADPAGAVARIGRKIAACQLMVSGVGPREAIQTVAHGDVASN